MKAVEAERRVALSNSETRAEFTRKRMFSDGWNLSSEAPKEFDAVLIGKEWLDAGGEIEQFLTCSAQYDETTDSFRTLKNLYELGESIPRSEIDWWISIPLPRKPTVGEQYAYTHLGARP